MADIAVSEIGGANRANKAVGSGLSLGRLYVMRATYLLIAVGLLFMAWPNIFANAQSARPLAFATPSLLGGISILAAIGIRYPVKLLPLLLFELVWKSIWLIAVALPLWRANALDANAMDSVNACVMGVVIMPIAIPWRYVWENYVKAAGERWV